MLKLTTILYYDFSFIKVSDTETRVECLLNNNKNSDFCAPLTAFDWNEVEPNLLGTIILLVYKQINY